MSNPNTRKSCVVPKCTSTTFRTPEKLFFYVPKNIKMRKKWIKAMKRMHYPFADKSVVYCCEDHFDVETDMENYIKYKLVGGRIKLKKGIIPHKFKCQQNKKEKPERSAVLKRERIRFYEKLLSPDMDPAYAPLEAAKPEEVFLKEEPLLEDPFNFENNDKCSKITKRDKTVQVKLKSKGASKSTMTDEKYFKIKKKKGAASKSTMTEEKYFR